MGIYIDALNAAALRKANKIVPVVSIKSPPPKGKVYVCLTIPFLTLLVVYNREEMRRVTQRSDGWKPEAMYLADIEDIVKMTSLKSGDITYTTK